MAPFCFLLEGVVAMRGRVTAGSLLFLYLCVFLMNASTRMGTE